MFVLRTFGFVRLGIVALYMLCAVAWAQEPLIVGEHYPIHIDSSGSSDVEGMSIPTGQVFELSHPGATYIAIHFAEFDLARGNHVIVSDPDGGQSYVLEGQGKMDAGIFWSQHVKGDTVLLELVSTHPGQGKGFVIDEYAAGFVDLGPMIEAICGTDDKENAICYQSSHPTEYNRGRAVARLLIQGSSLCTGWLASADDHLITNEHCITSATAALNTDYEFMSEAPTCGSVNCQLCYPGAIYSGSAFIQDDAGLDYALVQLAGDPAATYGYLEIDNRDASPGEEMYIPQHPGGRAKEFGIYSTDSHDTGGICRVYSITEPPCAGSGYYDVGYYCDTEGGSSGSPVLARSSHKVISLHHCALCPNRGVPIDLVCDEVSAYIPSCGGEGCTTHAECNDYNDCTEDLCVDTVCQNNVYPDGTSCASGICCGGTCTAPDCYDNGDCDDAEACTADVCYSGGTCSAFCDSTWPACDLGTPDGCCGPACTSSNDADCVECLPKKAPCTSDSECCSGVCHFRQFWCK